MKMQQGEPTGKQTPAVCPDCKSRGPHDVYKTDIGWEFVCSECGMQHPVPIKTAKGAWLP